MNILVIGAAGTIGRAVVDQLTTRHEVIAAGRSSGERVDMSDIASVRSLFERVSRVDAVVVAAGEVHFGPLSEMTPEQFGVGLQGKLMGQVNVALVAQHYLNDGGSITLTSGVLTDDPIRYGVSATAVNGAVEGFVRAAALELPRGIRINAVSPSVLEESLGSYGPYFLGFEAVPARRVALAFVKSIEGLQTGKVLRVL